MNHPRLQHQNRLSKSAPRNDRSHLINWPHRNILLISHAKILELRFRNICSTHYPKPNIQVPFVRFGTGTERKISRDEAPLVAQPISNLPEKASTRISVENELRNE